MAQPKHNVLKLKGNVIQYQEPEICTLSRHSSFKRIQYKMQMLTWTPLQIWLLDMQLVDELHERIPGGQR